MVVGTKLGTGAVLTDSIGRHDNSIGPMKGNASSWVTPVGLRSPLSTYADESARDCFTIFGTRSLGTPQI